MQSLEKPPIPASIRKISSSQEKIISSHDNIEFLLYGKRRPLGLSNYHIQTHNMKPLPSSGKNQFKNQEQHLVPNEVYDNKSFNIIRDNFEKKYFDFIKKDNVNTERDSFQTRKIQRRGVEKENQLQYRQNTNESCLQSPYKKLKQLCFYGSLFKQQPSQRENNSNLNSTKRLNHLKSLKHNNSSIENLDKDKSQRQNTKKLQLCQLAHGKVSKIVGQQKRIHDIRSYIYERYRVNSAGNLGEKVSNSKQNCNKPIGETMKQTPRKVNKQGSFKSSPHQPDRQNTARKRIVSDLSFLKDKKSNTKSKKKVQNEKPNAQTKFTRRKNLSSKKMNFSSLKNGSLSFNDNYEKNRSRSLFQTNETLKKIEKRIKLSSFIFQDAQRRNSKYEAQHLEMTFEKQKRQRQQLKDKINNQPQVLKRHDKVFPKEQRVPKNFKF